MLDDLYDLQKKFQIEILGNYVPEADDLYIKSKENVNELIFQILALIKEATEALDELPWKPWKNNQSFNLNKFQEELIDVFHFLLNLFMYSGMNIKEIEKLFKLKNKINIVRQLNGY